IKPGPAVHGVWDTYSYTYPGGTIDTFDQVAVTNSDRTQLYVLMVHCVATCYIKNRDQIDTIVSSFTVRSPYGASPLHLHRRDCPPRASVPGTKTGGLGNPCPSGTG